MAYRALAWIVLALAAFAAHAGSPLPPPADLKERVAFEQHLRRPMPVNTPLVDADGHPTRLAAIAAGKPLVVAFGYYRCPNLCDVTLHALAHAVAGMKLSPADDYRIVFISIDPRETPADARKARRMLAAMGPGGHVEDWTFATATPAAIGQLTDAAGFRYFYDARNKQFAHPAGAIILTGQGRIAQYFFGVSYPSRSLSLALIDASRGQIGTVLDQLVLFCCGYDPATGRYSLLVSRLMMVLGCGFVIVMLVLWWRLRGRSA
ncbi:SCO family protein [Luteibacter sp.]|uniref:SCO family protein n=1 Tax=Luteibacter sp. TaxID=1886636 RepID=UPI003F7FAC33